MLRQTDLELKIILPPAFGRWRNSLATIPTARIMEGLLQPELNAILNSAAQKLETLIRASSPMGCDFSRQGELKRCAPLGACRGPQATAMRFDDGTADRQSHAGALNLGPGVFQLRLMMNTLLSSIRSCSPIWRRPSSFFTAYSNRALQISFAGWR